jgi:hypothetical protein
MYRRTGCPKALDRSIRDPIIRSQRAFTALVRGKRFGGCPVCLCSTIGSMARPILATWEDPNLPLARLRSRGQLSEPRASDGVNLGGAEIDRRAVEALVRLDQPQALEGGMLASSKSQIGCASDRVG